ncbi:MAG: hypothetical protein LBN29_11345 [Mediterranea sp.]|jgi:hypothetical protein|nr:hypothetical protein [Mediterranea sp.]
MADKIDNDVALLHIEEQLSRHGEWLSDAFTRAIRRRKLVLEGNLLDSVGYETFREGDARGVRFNFLSYGRAIEIRARKRNRMAVDTNREIWGIKRNSPKTRDVRWYATNMFGGLNRLISRVMYGLGDDEIERLKAILERRKAEST